MKLHELSSIKKHAQRIGRGGKRGSYSGRGVKGQKSRAGRRLRPAERDIILRIPKRRGFRNLPKSDAPIVFNLGDISRKLASYATGKEPLALNVELLKTAGLLGKNFKKRVKLLGNGEAAFAMSVEGIKVSKSAEEKIRKAGGAVK